MQSIPASALVQVNPGVLTAGGGSVDLIGLILTANGRVPIGTVADFASASDVANFFGASAPEALAAATYFLGFDNSNVKPGSLLFAQYPTTAVAAYLRGGSGLTLAQVNLITAGVLAVTVDGQSFTSGSFNLGASGSFSAAAAAIQTAFAAFDAVVTGSISTTNLTVSAVASGTLAPGQVISGAGITVGTTIVSQTSGATGGIGVYVVSVSQTASSTTISAGPLTVTYDSVAGAFVITGGTPGATGAIGFATGGASASLLLTAATGAVISQGAAIATPTVFMNAIINLTQNWFTFSMLFTPSAPDRVAFAAWNNSQDDNFAYGYSETSAAATVANDTTLPLYTITQAKDDGTVALYEPVNYYQTAMLQGMIASIDFTEQQGRATLAYKSQSGQTPSVTNQSVGNNLIGNGYNFYGAYAARGGNSWNLVQPGQITGKFAWIDTYANQVWLNSGFVTAIMNLLTSAKSIPYNNSGYAQIEAACGDQIQAGVFNGVIQPGVPLSQEQALEVNTAAGAVIDTIISTRGWYLQVLPASATVRAARGSPPCTFWYNDGGSVQKVSLASIVIQ